MFRYRHFYCPSCDRVRRFRKRVPDHPMHGRFTLLTLGAWGLGWLILTLLSLRRRWHCAYCRGLPVRGHRFEAPPFAVWPTSPAQGEPSDSPASE